MEPSWGIWIKDRSNRKLPWTLKRGTVKRSTRITHATQGVSEGNMHQTVSEKLGKTSLGKEKAGAFDSDSTHTVRTRTSPVAPHEGHLTDATQPDMFAWVRLQGNGQQGEYQGFIAALLQALPENTRVLSAGSRVNGYDCKFTVIHIRKANRAASYG